MPTEATTPISSTAEIDWAFAGTSSTTPATGEDPEHTVWSHWVDSATADPESVKDEGDMIRLESGDAVERGQMINPKTGKMESYEESWADIKPSGPLIGWVVKTREEGARGMAIRIGGFAQGIMRTGTEVGIKRWSYVGGSWDTIVDIGSCDVPTELFEERHASMTEGKTFRGSSGLEWACIEQFAADR